MQKNKGFRAWFYFRNGWSLYFAFFVAAINTLTVTYYLAIERVPALLVIFPNFLVYVVIVGSIGIPLLVIIGYAHYKRTAGFRSEADISMETNPYQRRMVVNSESILKLNLKLIEMILQDKTQSFSNQNISELKDLFKEITDLLEHRTFSNNKDIEFLNKLEN